MAEPSPLVFTGRLINSLIHDTWLDMRATVFFLYSLSFYSKHGWSFTFLFANHLGLNPPFFKHFLYNPMSFVLYFIIKTTKTAEHIALLLTKLSLCNFLYPSTWWEMILLCSNQDICFANVRACGVKDSSVLSCNAVWHTWMFHTADKYNREFFFSLWISLQI